MNFFSCLSLASAEFFMVIKTPVYLNQFFVFLISFMSFLLYTDGPGMSLSYCYHGNHTVQVQTSSHPGLCGFEVWTGSYIQDMYIYGSFVQARPHLSADVSLVCIHGPFIMAACHYQAHFSFLSCHFYSSFPRWSDKSLKVLLTSRWWTREVNKPHGVTHFKLKANPNADMKQAKEISSKLSCWSRK